MPASPIRPLRLSVDRDVSAGNGNHVIEPNVPKRTSSITSASTPAMGAPTTTRGRRESRPITSIATTTKAPQPPSTNTAHGSTTTPGTTRTEDTTFSLPIDIIDTPDLDELGLSPVGSAPTTDRKSTRLNSSHSQISYA